MNGVFPSGIQIQCGINQSDCSANTEIAMFFAYSINSPVYICAALCVLIFRKQRQLRHFICRYKAADLYGQASDRLAAGVAAPEDVHSGFLDCQSAVGGARQL